MSSKRKSKFNVGQVVAECYDFGDGKGEFVRSYFTVSKNLLGLISEKKRKFHNGVRYDRPLTAIERGPALAPSKEQGERE